MENKLAFTPHQRNYRHKKGESESRQGGPHKTSASPGQAPPQWKGRLTFLPSAGRRKTKSRGGVARYLRRQIALPATGGLQQLSRYISIYCNCQLRGEKKTRTRRDKRKGENGIGRKHGLSEALISRDKGREDGVTSSCLAVCRDAKNYLTCCCASPLFVPRLCPTLCAALKLCLVSHASYVPAVIELT